LNVLTLTGVSFRQPVIMIKSDE